MRNSAIIPWNLHPSEFQRLIDSMFDEVLIYDNQYTIVYINDACSRHYGYQPEQMIGKSFFEFVDGNCWDISVLPVIYEKKKTYAVKQKTKLGSELLTIAVPIFDSQKNLAYVIMNVRDNLSGVKLFNPDYIYRKSSLSYSTVPMCKSREMEQVIQFAERISQVDVTCILTGESGTGKTMVARYIHSISPRNARPFISLNCASIPNELVESELFGYIKGAFTGANTQGKKGLFEAASGGTLLLDEIAELSLSTQAKLLHVLQDHEFIPIGGSSPVKVDVRIIAATNKNLRQMVADGQFREDLFYRLNVVEIYLPPLRKRKADIPDLIQQFLKEFNEKYNLSRSLDSHALETLVNYEWKGNVRELRHMIERLVVTVTGDLITTGHLPQNMTGSTDTGTAREVPKITDYHTRMQNFEGAMVREAYHKCGSSRKMAAYLNISQTKANRLIQKYLQGNGSKKDIAVHPAGAEDLLQ